MNTNRYIILCALTFMFCTLAWVFNLYADANAYYLRDVNAGLSSRVSKYMNFSILNLVFYTPFIVVVLLKSSMVASAFWLILSAFLSLITYSFIGEGGDVHGCESCAGILYLYIYVLPFLAAFTFMVFLIRKLWRWRRE